MDIKFSELIDNYPEITETNIQTLISSKYEFKELSGTPKEMLKKKGTFFKHQRWVQRFLVPYDRLFLFHKTGTGKSCTIVAAGEHFKRLKQKGESTINKIIILVKGETLAVEFKKQIACECTIDEYIPKGVYTEGREQKKAISRAIKKWYSIQTYQKFISKILEMTDKQLEDEFSGVMFFVDEIHNLRNDSDSNENNTNIKVYNFLHKLFHIIKRSKVVLASATPMINNSNEIAKIMNLLLPLDNQIPSNIDYSNISLQEIEPYFRGKISYVRELDTGAVPSYQGEKLNVSYNGVRSQSYVYICPIIPNSIQSKGYIQALSVSESWRENKRQASNFVFPDGSWGGTFDSKQKDSGLGKYVFSEGEDVYEAKPELKRILSDPIKLRQHSMKYYMIVDILKTQEGNAFIYDEFKFGSGVIILGLTLEANGFTRFMETNTVFVSETGASKGYCSVKTRERRNIRLDKRLRFGLLTSDTSGPRRDAMLELFNSYENRYGEYLKAIIGSPMSRDGLNLANGQIFINVGPGWHQSGMYQAMSRVIRATSHIDLLSDMKNIPEDQRKVDVKIYNLAATLEGYESSDLFMYEYAEQKDINIKRMERMMKQCAVDCQSHYKRNVRTTDVDGSKECDYTTCQYKCIDPLSKEIDLSTWKLMYGDEIIDIIKERIKRYFKFETRITFDGIKELTRDILSKGYPEFLIYRSLFELIVNNVPIINSLGLNTYIRNEGEIFYTIQDYPIKPYTCLDSYYNENTSFIQKLNFQDYIKQTITSEEILLSNVDLTETNINTQITVFEKEFDPNDLKSNLVELYSKSIFIFREPIDILEEKKNYIAMKGTGKGRRSKDPSKKPKEKEDKLDEDEVLEDLDKGIMLKKYLGDTLGEKVYLHTLKGQDISSTSYGTTSRFLKGGKLRILKPSEGLGWRDLKEFEQLVYGPLVQYTLIKRNKEFFARGVYGTVLADGKFRVRAKTDIKRVTAKGKKDNRVENTGKICTVWDKVELLKVFRKLDMEPDYSVLPKNYSYEFAIKFLNSQGFADTNELEELSDEDLKFYTAWYIKSYTIKQLCDIIYDYFEENDLLFVN